MERPGNRFWQRCIMDMRELTSLYKKALELDEGFFHWSNPDICNAHWLMALDESFILKAKLLNYYYGG